MSRLRHTLAALTLALIAPIVASCSSETPDGPPAPPSAEKQLELDLESELRNRWQRPELKNYLMLTNSFIGGTFPRKTAVLLRESQELVSKYVNHLETSGSADPGVLEAHKALVKYTGEAAELYELMAAQPKDAVRDTRNGLEISDPYVHSEYNRRVDLVNAAHDRLDGAIKALTPEQQMSFRRMAVATRLK